MKKKYLDNLEKIQEFRDLINDTKVTFTTEDFYHLEKNRKVFTDAVGTYIVYLDKNKKHFDFIFIPVVKQPTRPRKGV